MSINSSPAPVVPDMFKRHLIVVYSVIFLMLSDMAVSAELQAGPSSANQTEGVDSSKQQTEVCGVGVVNIDPSDSSALNKYLHDITRNGVSHWRASLEKNANADVRSLGLILNFVDIYDDTTPGSPEQALLLLTQLAKKTKNPAVYAIVRNICRDHYDPQDAYCNQLFSDKRWVQLDKDNAVPWLMLAAEYQFYGDSRHFEEAFEKASKAKRIESYYSAWYQLTNVSLSPELTALEKHVIWSDILDEESVFMFSGSDLVEDVCSETASRNDRRYKECKALANLYIDHGSTVMDMGAGVAIGKIVGWSQHKLDSLMEKVRALSKASVEERFGFDPTNDSARAHFDCQSIERTNTYFEQLGKLGDLGAAEYFLRLSRERSKVKVCTGPDAETSACEKTDAARTAQERATEFVEPISKYRAQ